MLPILTVILAIVLGLSYPESRIASRSPDLLGALLAVVFVGLASLVLAVKAVRRAGKTGPCIAAVRVGRVSRPAAVAVYGLVIWVLDWPAITGPGYLDVRNWVLVDEMMILLPFAAMLLLSHLASFLAESRLELHDFTVWGYLSVTGRQYLLPVVPVLLFLLIGDLAGIGSRRGVGWIAELQILHASFPFIRWLSLLLLLFFLYCLIPFLMRWAWRARPLPPGPIRDRLLGFARREGFRARDILVWPTGHNVLNAAVVGVAGPVRYVLLTDALLEELRPDEIEAVFAHEAGHAKHRHVLLYLLFTLGFALLLHLILPTLERRLEPSLGTDPLPWVLLVAALFLLWFGLLFGFVSRRFEQQADVYGLLATGRARGERGDDPAGHPFVRALEGLSHQMGDIREARGWRHFSLANRIGFLTRFLSDEGTRRRHHAGMARLRLLILLVLLGLGVAAALTIPRQLKEGRLAASVRRYRWLTRQDRIHEALWEFMRANELAQAAGREPPGFLPSRSRDPDPERRALRLLEQTRRPAPAPLSPRLIFLELAWSLERLGDREMSRQVLYDALERFGDDPFFLHLLALQFRRDGRIGNARTAWRAALERTPPDLGDMRERFERELDCR